MESVRTLNFTVQVLLLKEVNELQEGKAFGELALLTEKPRNATIYSKSPKAALGFLTKKDYQRLIGEDFKSKMEKAVAVLR